jgi:hypothetical protein
VAGVLLLTAETLNGDSLDRVVEELKREEGDGPVRVHVVSPQLVDSGLKFQLGDVDAAREPARQRLEETLEALQGAGIEASGEVGDADPVQAISDELQKFHADRIVIVDHADEDEAAYAEKGILERVNREFDPPATELRVAHGGDDVVDRRTASAGAKRAEEGERVPSSNFPPFRKQDGFGLLVAILGTIVLIIIAASCGRSEGEGEGTGIDRCGFVYLIAGGFFLINLGHVGALLLMESVGYRGPFERFFARLSLIGTPIAIVVAALLAFA